MKATEYFSRFDRHLLSFAHELSSPLTAAQLSLDDYLHSGNSEGLEALSSHLKLMEDYLETARQQIKYRQVASLFSVDKQLNIVIRSLTPLARKMNVLLQLSLADDTSLSGNPTSFKQIISSVIKNAIESYEDNFEINRVVAIDCQLSKDYLVITVSDNGRGIENEQEIFKPYYSTKHAASGLGIGLSLASESIALDFGGYISLSTNKDFATCFRLGFLSKK